MLHIMFNIAPSTLKWCEARKRSSCRCHYSAAILQLYPTYLSSIPICKYIYFPKLGHRNSCGIDAEYLRNT